MSAHGPASSDRLAGTPHVPSQSSLSFDSTAEVAPRPTPPATRNRDKTELFHALTTALRVLARNGPQERALKASRLDAQLAEAQLQALQRQLHPHFLFNTLNAISALMHRDVEAADQMLSATSNLMR